MDDTVELEFCCHFQMLPKNFALLHLIAPVIRGSEFGFPAGQTVIVQSSFTQSNYLWIPRQFAQGRPQVLRRVGRVGRMPTDYCKHLRETFCKLNRPFAALEIRS